MKLYRPVGVAELRLIAKSDYRAFPPRLDWQPIFYPVLLLDYAIQIARNWNTGDAASGYAGFVTVFEVPKSYLEQFPVQVVGAEDLHRELWVPAEQLEEFNAQLLGPIEVVGAYFGERFETPEDLDLSAWLNADQPPNGPGAPG